MQSFVRPIVLPIMNFGKKISTFGRNLKFRGEGGVRISFSNRIPKNQNLQKSTLLSKHLQIKLFTIFINPVTVLFEGSLTIVLTFRDFNFSKTDKPGFL